MNDLSSQFPQSAVDTRDNLTRLLNLGRRRRARVNRRYTFFVRSMKVLLPVIALGIVVIVMAWPKMDDTISAVPREDIIPQKTGQNELIKPRFENTDSKGNPYVITAERAVQDLGDEAAVLLEKPVADIDLGQNEKISGQSAKGTYSQKDSLLTLEDDITLTHSNGYSLSTSQMTIDTKLGTATSTAPVAIAGPDGTLSAASMRADNTSGTIVFQGPAKLVLKKSIKGL